MTRTARRWTALVAAGAAAAALSGCTQSRSAAPPVGSFSEEDVRNRVGERVELEVEANRILGPHAFTVGGDAAGESPLLVVAAAVPDTLEPSDTVTITGTVVVFDIVAWEDALDVDIEDEEAEDFAGEPAVRADSVTLT